MKRGSSKKMNMDSLSVVLKNRNILFFLSFASGASLFYFLLRKQLDAVAFFIIIGFIASYFSKNMSIILLTSILSTFFLIQIKMLGGRVQEGMDGEKEEAAEEEETATAASASPASAPAKDESKHTERVKKTASKTEVDGTKTKTTKKEKFTQKLSPAEFTPDEDDSARHKPKVDYAATLETAYDNLDKLLSSDAIRNMSEETTRLAEKQQKLMGNIKEIAPMMDKAASMLSNLDVGNISKMMTGIQQRITGFGGNAATLIKPEQKSEGMTKGK
jgi:hypothetical protein